MTLWGGRFSGSSDPLFRRFNDSLRFDHRLVQHDIEGSIAWAGALAEAGVLGTGDRDALITSLRSLQREAEADPEAVRASGEEDVHSWVESRLVKVTGDLGRRLHTGRSRNDQVATDLRLYARTEAARRVHEIRLVQAALVRLARREIDTVIPGYTHLQRAQPVLMAHWCLAYFEMLDRDAGRLGDSAARGNFCPLGSGALAGTAYPIDRHGLAQVLGFDGPTDNSLDAVSDRDFAVELLAAASLASIHLSRLAEDLITWSSAEFSFIELAEAFTSGSSLMPQKKNPDALELVRGKSGRIIGSLTALLVTLKGLPLAYNKDLQEDKEPLFDGMEQLSQCLQVLAPLLDGATVRREVARAAAEGGFANATDLADCLVEQGVSFREAHDRVGRMVRRAIERHERLEDLPLNEVQSAAPQMTPAAWAATRGRLTIDSVLGRRNVHGGTAPARVRRALDEAASRLARRGISVAPPDAGSAPAALTIRQARIDDLDDICRLVDYWTREGENLPRSREAILEAIADFGVAERGGTVIGCGSLSIYTPALAEIRSLGVDPAHHGGGAGSALVRHFLEQAAVLHIPRVFVLTRAPAFFERLGFRVVSIDTLPEKVFKDCNACPKKHCCDEIAMVHEVATVPAAGTAGVMRLRVVGA